MGLGSGGMALEALIVNSQPRNTTFDSNCIFKTKVMTITFFYPFNLKRESNVDIRGQLLIVISKPHTPPLQLARTYSGLLALDALLDEIA